MRRVTIAIALLAAIGIGVALLGHNERSVYRVAAIFDTAKGMVPGQQIKIAGAVVGKVDKVELTPGPKARILMSVDRRFAPFRQDARCAILPEGLISENYVDCRPGSPQKPALSAAGLSVPTVPLAQTSVPTSLQDFINVFSLPVDQRLRVIFNELGIATAGRGEDINALLRRSNPALDQSRRVLAIIDGQRRRIAEAIGHTDRVLAALAADDGDVRRFVDRAARVADTTAPHYTAIRQSLRRLPPMLDAVRPGLSSLDRAMAEGTPLLRQLRVSAPGLMELTRALPTFTEAGVPAWRSLASMADTGRTAVRAARPIVGHMNTASAAAKPFAKDLESYMTSIRDKGGIEGTNRLFYSWASYASGYDSLSHMVTANNLPLTRCLADKGAYGCSAKYSAPGQGTIPANDPECGPQSSATWAPPTACRPDPAGEQRQRAGRRRPAPRRKRRAEAPAGPAQRPASRPKPPVEAPAKPGQMLEVPQLPSPLRTADDLLDYLLGP